MLKITATGNLTNDVELKTQEDGRPYAILRIASDRRYRAKDGSQLTDFVSVKVRGRLAERCAAFAWKGCKLAAAGDFETIETNPGCQPGFFPYEDNLGMFEDADGRQLLRWLTAAHFHAVDWTIVPGTCYEAATLREVDISAPEYQAFEKQLYEKVLERMGFQDFLAPKQEVNAIEKTTELKLYSPLRAELVEEPPVRDGIDEPEPPGSQFLTSDDLSAPAFRAAILQGIKDEQLPEETERGLMFYYDGPSSVDEKVISFFPSAEEVDGRLYGVAVCQVKGQLTPDELEELKEYCTAQYADAWGEGYEQRPRKTEYGELYVSFWQDKGFFIQTKEELETVKAPARSRPQVRRDGGER